MGKDQDEVDTALELIKEKKLRGIIFLGGDFRKNKERIAKIKVPFVVSRQHLINCRRNVSHPMYQLTTVRKAVRS